MTKDKSTLLIEQSWENATLANNFIFYKVMRHHPEACKHLIEMLLKIQIDRIEIQGEETMFIDHDSRGIRLDVYVKDTNRIFDVEMQTTNTDDIPKRSRYYQGVMDVDNLKSGMFYRDLKESHVIFICLEDIFHNNLPVNTFRNVCQEDGKTILGDLAFKHFFFAPLCAKMIDDERTRNFFEFLISNKPADDFTDNLGEFVADAKHNTQWRLQYMTWERYMNYAREEGYDAGKKEGIADGSKQAKLEAARNLLANGVNPEIVAKSIGFPLEQVLAIKEEQETEPATR